MKLQRESILNRNIFADDTLIRFVQIRCFVASILVLSLILWKLPRLDLRESQMFFGVLLSLITPLLIVLIALVLPMARAAKHASPEPPANWTTLFPAVLARHLS